MQLLSYCIYIFSMRIVSKQNRDQNNMIFTIFDWTRLKRKKNQILKLKLI